MGENLPYQISKYIGKTWALKHADFGIPIKKIRESTNRLENPWDVSYDKGAFRQWGTDEYLNK